MPFKVKEILLERKLEKRFKLPLQQVSLNTQPTLRVICDSTKLLQLLGSQANALKTMDEVFGMPAPSALVFVRATLLLSMNLP